MYDREFLYIILRIAMGHQWLYAMIELPGLVNFETRKNAALEIPEFPTNMRLQISSEHQGVHCPLDHQQFCGCAGEGRALFGVSEEVTSKRCTPNLVANCWGNTSARQAKRACSFRKVAPRQAKVRELVVCLQCTSPACSLSHH